MPVEAMDSRLNTAECQHSGSSFRIPNDNYREVVKEKSGLCLCRVKALYERSLKIGGRQYAGEFLVHGRPL